MRTRRSWRFQNRLWKEFCGDALPDRMKPKTKRTPLPKLPPRPKPLPSPREGPQLFIGKYPCGLVYADRWHEVGGDYKRLAFLSYATLELELEKNCPAHLAEQIQKDAAGVQAMRGQFYQITTSGQGVILGKP